MPVPAAAIVGRVAAREPREERFEERREQRRVVLVLDPDAARDARLDLLHEALRERLGLLLRGLLDPAPVLAVADVPVRLVLRPTVCDAQGQPEIPTTQGHRNQSG
jgi:hypothetical protein